MDGICKCFVRQVCDDQNNKLALCTSIPSGNWRAESGEFSVVPKRLPVKQIRTGDLGSEGMKYTLSKLKCTFYLSPKIRILNIKKTDEHSCVNIANALIDEDLNTCKTFNEKSPIYELNSVTNYTKVNFKIKDSPNENCASKILPFVSEKNRYKICKYTMDCEYSCPSSTILHFQVVPEDKEEFSIGEIELF